MMNPDLATTALGPGDPDDGDMGRQQRGMAIAALVHIEKNRLGYKVPSQSGNGSYVVSVDDEPFCSCPDFEKRQQPCKHIYAVELHHPARGAARRNHHRDQDDASDLPAGLARLQRRPGP